MFEVIYVYIIILGFKIRFTGGENAISSSFVYIEKLRLLK